MLFRIKITPFNYVLSFVNELAYVFNERWL